MSSVEQLFLYCFFNEIKTSWDSVADWGGKNDRNELRGFKVRLLAQQVREAAIDKYGCQCNEWPFCGFPGTDQAQS